MPLVTRGNTNTTTRFRRYIGDPQLRPPLPEHDLASAQALLQPNVTQKLQLVANRGRIQYYHDGHLIFDFHHSILSTLHVHLDHDHCLEVLVVRGKSAVVRKVADVLISTKGVKHGRLTITTTGQELK